MAESEIHKRLKRKAIEWLNQTGCFVVAEEVSYRGKIFDAIGIKRNGTSYCIEIKATQKDLDRRRQTSQLTDRWRRYFNFYYLMLPPDLKPDWEWEGWGIIRCYDNEGLKARPIVERKAKRTETERFFGDTIELIIQMAASLTNKIYYQI